MNGKQAKLLRKLGRSDKQAKRLHNALDHKTKGALRNAVKGVGNNRNTDIVNEIPQEHIDEVSGS